MNILENKPTAKEYAQIFMQYLGQPVEIYPGGSPKLIGIFKVNDEVWLAQYNLTVPPEGVELKHARLILKPLNQISEEHEMMLYNILFYNKNHISTSNEKILYVQQFLKEGFRKPRKTEQNTIDQLREWGYAMPYKNWTVEQLVELGIYKLIK